MMCWEEVGALMPRGEGEGGLKEDIKSLQSHQHAKECSVKTETSFLP